MDVLISFVYFDHKSQQVQAPEDVIACLLKQVLTKFDDVHVPPELVTSYDHHVSKGKRFDQSTLLQFLTTYSKKFSTVYAVFDALDECSESYQSKLFTLFGTLQQSGYYRLLGSFRPHLSKFQKVLGNPQILEVRADELDLEKYVGMRLEEKGNKISKLREECVQLAKGVDGM
jgi:hypothetical protein